MHDLLPAAGQQGHGLQRQGYSNFPPHRHVQVRALLNKCSVHDHDIHFPASGHQGLDAQDPDYCNYLSQLPHHNIQVRAFPDEWSVHDLVTHLPAAGHHDYDAQHPDYSNYMPH